MMLAIAAVPLIVFLVALLRTDKASDVANALGNVVGGLVGAAAAVGAVYLTIRSQRNEDAAKVATAVRTEVLTYAKYVIGAIEVCIEVRNGTVQIPRTDATYISKNLAIEPVIYPAVADRVGLLPHPQATVEFYGRIAEAKAMLEVLAKAQPVSQTMYVNPPAETVTAANAQATVDCLATALQLAAPIVADVAKPEYHDRLDVMARQTTVQQISDCLTAARAAFPDAISFADPGSS